MMSVGACCSMLSSVQNALSRSFNSYNSPPSRSHCTSCRDMHASQGSLVFGARDGQPCTPLGLCVSTKLEATVRARPELPASFISFRRPHMCFLISSMLRSEQ